MLNELYPINQLFKKSGVFDTITPVHGRLRELTAQNIFRLVVKNGIPSKIIPMEQGSFSDGLKFGPSTGAAWTTPVFNFKKEGLESALQGLKLYSMELQEYLNGSFPKFKLMLQEVAKADDTQFLAMFKNLSEKTALKKSDQLILDLDSTVYDTGFFQRLNKALWGFFFTHGSGLKILDAFGNECDSSEISESFPSINTSLGPVRIRSLGEDTPCRNPYQGTLSGPKAFPVSAKLRAEMGQTLRSLLDDDAKYKTWKTVKIREKDPQWGVFIAYSNEKRMRRFIQGDLSEEKYTIEDFLTDYRSIKIFDKVKPQTENGIFLLLLEKRGKSYFTFAFSAEISAQDYVHAFSILVQAHELVKETISFSTRHDKETEEEIFYTVGSNYLIELMHTILPTAPKRPKVLRSGVVKNLYRLFYSRDTAGVTDVIQNYVQFSMPILRAFSLVSASTDLEQKYFIRNQAVKVAIVLSYLFLKFETKEVLMDHPAYLLGRLFNMYDQLHKCYLKAHNCKGSTVPVGSTAFQVASQYSIQSAMVKIASRQSFLHNIKSRDNKIMGKIHSLLGSIRKISTQINDLDSNFLNKTRLTPEEVGRMSLGFMNDTWC